MFESVQNRVEGDMFSESVLEEAKIRAVEMIDRNESFGNLNIGGGTVSLTTEKEGSGSIMASFLMGGKTFYITLPKKEG
jgi:hypothetical protein